MTTQPDSGVVRSFAGEYAQMGEIELMQLAAAYDSLVEPAQDALRAEFARRKMEPPIVEEREEVDSQPLVTVRRYRDLTEAIVGRAMLESAGIFCFLRDENVVRLDWAYSNAVGGIRLEVRPEDLAAGEELLSQPIPESIAYEGKEEYLQPHCPRCGSTDITFEGRERSAAIASTFVLGLPLPLGGESWLCHSCGSRWVDDSEESAADAGNQI